MNNRRKTACETTVARSPVARRRAPARSTSTLARRTQSGAAAIEFAFVFPLLFALMYATIVYGYVFFAQQTINMVAQETAKAAIAAAPFDAAGNPAAPDYAGTAQHYFALAKTQGLLQYIAGTATLVPTGPTDVPGGGDGKIFTVTVKLDGLTGKDGVFPTISLGVMGLGDVPPMPDKLTATASVRVS